MRAWLVTLMLCVWVAHVWSTEARSSAARLAFKRHNPCPSTGLRRGACPGYVIDHPEPLCAGGADRVDNMQWQTRADSIRKDADERRLCRSLRRK